MFTADQQELQEPAQREPIQLPKSEPEPALAPQSPTTREPESPTYQPESPSYEPQYEPEPELEPEPEPEPEPAHIPSPDAGQPGAKDLLHGALPPRQEEDQEEEDQNWDGESEIRTGTVSKGRDQNWDGESERSELGR